MTNAIPPDGLLPLEQRGSSSIEGTAIIRSQLSHLFSKYKIYSMFDAGATDAAWQQATLAKEIKYSAGEINQNIVNYAKSVFPDLDIRHFDITKDLPPKVDLLFVRDVTIHLNTAQKTKFVDLWLNSDVPYLLISHNCLINDNVDFELGVRIQVAEANWCLPPWNWPDPLESLWEMDPNGRSMSLWHQSQIIGIK